MPVPRGRSVASGCRRSASSNAATCGRSGEVSIRCPGTAGDCPPGGTRREDDAPTVTSPPRDPGSVGLRLIEAELAEFLSEGRPVQPQQACHPGLVPAGPRADLTQAAGPRRPGGIARGGPSPRPRRAQGGPPASGRWPPASPHPRRRLGRLRGGPSRAGDRGGSAGPGPARTACPAAFRNSRTFPGQACDRRRRRQRRRRVGRRAVPGRRGGRGSGPTAAGCPPAGRRSGGRWIGRTDRR